MNTKDTSQQHKFYLLEDEDITSDDLEDNMWLRKLEGLDIPEKKIIRPRMVKRPKIMHVSHAQKQALVGGENG